MDIPLLKDVRTEDIEDVTGRYLHMFTEERNSDSVSRVKTKDFKYPPILPIVFYDGVENWTASNRLHDRILFSDVFS